MIDSRKSAAIRQFGITAVFLTTLVVAASRPAQAITEFCPAEIYRAAPVRTTVGAADLWAYTLWAWGPRTVSGTILAQTDLGWFVFPFNGVVLAGQTVQYESPYVTFSRNEFESAPLYVRFPGPARIERWWVSTAWARGDVAFGWGAKGQVGCLPGPGVAVGQSSGAHSPRRTTPLHDLSVPPAPGTLVSLASATLPPLGATACATPFTDARVVRTASLQYPHGYEGVTTEVTVAVAIDRNGNLADAWLFYASGLRDFDDEAISVARGSTYAAGTSLCQAAPGLYLFVADFHA